MHAAESISTPLQLEQMLQLKATPVTISACQILKQNKTSNQRDENTSVAKLVMSESFRKEMQDSLTKVSAMERDAQERCDQNQTLVLSHIQGAHLGGKVPVNCAQGT